MAFQSLPTAAGVILALALVGCETTSTTDNQGNQLVGDAGQSTTIVTNESPAGVAVTMGPIPL